MNGQKAYITNDELVKSEILSKASRTNNVTKPKTETSLSEANLNDLLQVIKTKVGEEWEVNALRSTSSL